MAAIDSESLLWGAIFAARRAGEKILAVYNTEFSVEEKSDRSPLTLADKRAHEVISAVLNEVSSFPLLSEEGRNIPYSERKDWECFWLVDPLDGTKEFVKRNGEFTVNIALIRGGRPVLGVIYVPVKDVLYFAEEGLGAYKLEKTREGIAGLPDINSVIPAEAGIQEKVSDSILKTASGLPLPKESDRPFTVVASRSHMSRETGEYIDKLREEHSSVELISAGSSLKLCLVAEGKADAYPRFAPTMEWDTAAGQAIVEAAGGSVSDAGTHGPLRYNKENLLNPWFLAKTAMLKAGQKC